MAARWAIDLGSTNTVVAVEDSGSVRTVTLPELGRTLPVEQSPLIPSALHVCRATQRWLWFHRSVREVVIGQQALSRNFDGCSPSFAQGFKRVLASQPHRRMVDAGPGLEFSARDVTRLFLGELLAALKHERRASPSDLTMSVPVGFYDQYRAELQSIVRSLGVRRFQSVDEPVAAAIGYGVNVARDERLLVVDFGGGTLNLAVVRVGPHSAESGRADVLAKHMVPMGGDDVDRWLVEHFVQPELRELPEWRRDILWEAMWVKERVSRTGSGEFRWGGLHRTITREEMVKLLGSRGLYRQLRTGLEDIQRQLALEGPGGGVDQVLLVGGSTLLPEVAAVVDEAFPQAVVRHDPEFVFTSVALGAARFAAGTPLDDFVYHDYALAVQNEKTHTVDYELLVPRRTRYPTASDFTMRYYADYPGMSEVRFSICEIGRLGQAPVQWERRPNGAFYWTPRTDEERALVVDLNPADPALPLRPAGQGASARLRVTYFVSDERWLCTTVEDLVSKQPLREGQPVVRLR